MLVDNYYKALLKFHCGEVQGLSCIRESGSSISINYWEGLKIKQHWSKIRFGTSNIKETKDDYRLLGSEIEELIQQNTNYQYDLLEDGVKITRIMNIYNSGAEQKTIGEMVWDSVIYESKGVGLNYVYNVILDRTAFDEPIIILPGESKQINYSIFFKYGN